MASNEQLTKQLALDLGVDITNRRPYAKEVFKYFDMDLLPHSSEATLLGEIFEWSGRNWRTTENNVIGYITPDPSALLAQLKAVTKASANVPDFEFTKSDLIDMGVTVPIYGISLKGKIADTTDLSIKMTGITKSRLTNVEQPGIEIKFLLSQFAANSSQKYRQAIKSNYLANALFYAQKVEIVIKKTADVDAGVSFDPGIGTVAVNADTDTEKNYTVTYGPSENAPFAASFVKGKDYLI